MSREKKRRVMTSPKYNAIDLTRPVLSGNNCQGHSAANGVRSNTKIIIASTPSDLKSQQCQPQTNAGPRRNTLNISTSSALATQLPYHKLLLAEKGQFRGDIQSENQPNCEPQTSCRRPSCNQVPSRASRQSYFHATQSPLIILDSHNHTNPIIFLARLLHGGKQQILTTR